MNQTVLADIGVYLPQNLAAQMRKSNKVFARKNNLTDISIMPFKIPEVCKLMPIMTAQQKINYINKRLGCKLNISDAPKYNIMISLIDFMKENNIESIEGFKPSYLSYIDENYVGFVSTNKNCIILRRINDNEYIKGTQRRSQRYIKLILDRKNIDPNTFYNIPTSFDIMGTEPINVHISEGPFDILSVMLNDVFETNSNNMFFAVCGFGYTSVIKHIIMMGACPNINLYVYADNDKSDNEIKRLILPKKQGVVYYLNSLTIVRNSFYGEKDFGVPKDRIKPSYKKIPIIV
jgi:hypothetical protein